MKNIIKDNYVRHLIFKEISTTLKIIYENLSLCHKNPIL